MKNSIVLKLFLLTTSLCMLILMTIFIGQTVFFKQYYANKKVDDIEESIQYFKEEYLQAGENVTTIHKLEQDFYQKNTTWIMTLDSVGNIKYANDFSVEIQLDSSQNNDFSNRVITIPLYSFTGLEDLQRLKFNFEQGKGIIIDGVIKDDFVIPAIITAENVALENRLLSEKLYGKKDAAPTFQGYSSLYLTGVIENLQLPEGSNVYTNRVVIERIKQFQVDLISNGNQKSIAEILDYEENNMNYKIFINPIKDTNGETTYIFAMTSLQPVDEAVQMLGDYYIYLIIFVLLLIILASFYYSKIIAKPLLQINDTTNKIANLDFSETIPIKRKDEIGTLSRNINTLSTTLHLYINQLQNDIEKEKQLENTRKEFISGVSHELKTPLSIMKSCISI